MSNYSTSFYINLAGNLPTQARRFGGAITAMAARSSRAMGGVKKAVANVSNKIDSIGNRAAIAGVGMTYAFQRTLVRTAAEVEMAGIRMKQTFGAESDKAMAFLTKFATETTLQFSDTQQAMMRLKTAGIDPMNGSLQALVDYNAKVGGDASNLDGYIHAISKAFIKGKLSMEEVNPLLERNVKVFELLAQETGGKYTAEQMQEMLSKGKLGRKSIEALLRAMGKDAKGAAKEQMKTWDGLTSNLEDNFSAMSAKIMEKGAFDHLKKELGGLLDWVNEKLDNGEFDEFAQQVSDNLVEVLKAAKDGAIGLKDALSAIGEAIGWVAELSGGYANLAKILVAVYAANKVLRSSYAQSLAKGAWGVGQWGYGKMRRKSPVADVAGKAVGAMAGVQPVYVTNFADMGMGLGGKRKKGRKPKQTRAQKTTQSKPKTTQPKPQSQTTKPTTPKSTVPKPVVPTPHISHAAAVANSAKAAQAATTAATSATKAVAKSVPIIGTAANVAMGAAVLLDEEASTVDKGEAIGSMVGASVGAVVGQALIPIPVVGAMVGGVIGDWLGSWLGGETAKNIADDKPQKVETETKLDGQIAVKITAPQGFGVVTQQNDLKVSGSGMSNLSDAMVMAVKTGNTSVGIRGGQ